MPVYEFACNACGNKVSVFVRSISSEINGRCDRCGSDDLRRLISRFAVIRSEYYDTDSFGENPLDGFDENDPRAMAAWARRMQQETGGEMGPEFDDMVTRLEAGESLEDDFGFGGHDHGDDDFGGL
jgi:putative FmdB family regulatory protein